MSQETSPPSNNKPTWLQILEAESWEAELIVSGIAIFGTLQLPGLLRQGNHYVLLHFSEDYYLVMYFILWYLVIASMVLIINFIAHFVLRALWVGTVGLASVFPNGIQAKDELYGKHFMEQLKHDFPDIGAFNQQLDRFCSLIFAFTFGSVILFLSITFWLFVALALIFLLRLVWPALPVSWGLGIFMALLFLPMLTISVLGQKSLRDRKWVQKIHYPLFKKALTVIFLVLFKPYIYIFYTFMSNLDLKRFGIIFSIYLIVIMTFGVPVLFKSNGMYLLDEGFFEIGERSDRLYPMNYEDEIGEDQYILQPIIPSQEVRGASLRLFIPVAESEEDKIEVLCGDFEPADSLSRGAKRKARRRFRLDCYVEQYQLFIDDTVLQNYQFRFYSHPQNGEAGIITYLPTAPLQSGEHVLRIRYPYEGDGPEGKREVEIPFWYSE